MKYLVLIPVLVLSGCGGSTAQNTELVTCQSEATAVSVLADFKNAGKLSASVIAAVDKDIALVDPVCSATAPTTTLSGAAQVAASELVSLAAGGQ